MNELDANLSVGIVPSPCINACAINTDTGLCEGCLRTLDEIAQWRCATDQVKRAIWHAISLRRGNVA